MVVEWGLGLVVGLVSADVCVEPPKVFTLGFLRLFWRALSQHFVVVGPTGFLGLAT